MTSFHDKLNKVFFSPFLQQLNAKHCWIQNKVPTTVSIPMAPIVSTLPAISNVNLAFSW